MGGGILRVGREGFVELLAGASKHSLSLTLLSQRLNARVGGV
jgi:hypothetical protein